MLEELIAITPNVWLFPCDDDEQAGRIQPSVGIICTATRTLLVDAGNSPAHARRIRAALDRIAAPPVRFVIYTHHHWDHVFGAQVFGAPVIAHELGRELVGGLAARPWGRRELAQLIADEPERAASYTALLHALADDAEIEVCVPSLTFAERLRLYVDDLTIELEHVGGQHAPDSIVVRVPEAGVLFLGDCYYPPPLHLRTAESAPDVSMLASLLSDRYAWYIAGHDRPHTHAELRTALAATDADA
jgi:glyoxylase-like metal-dependent hydrolase (beta-lactamase superfamily II)